MDETRRRSGCGHPLACALASSAVRGIGGAGIGPSLAVLGWLAVAALATMGAAGESPPSRAGVEVVLQFGEQEGQSQSDRTEQPTFRPGTPIPLVVRVQNRSAAAWSAEALSLTWTFRVTDLGTGEVLQSPAASWRGIPKGAKGRVEPGLSASFHVDLQALYPYDSGAPVFRSVWRPGEYSVRVAIVIPRPAYGRLAGDDASREPVESAALRFRVVGPTENDLPRYLRAASVGPLEERLKTIKVLGAARLRSASAKLTALALCDPSDAVRFEALCALGRIGKVGPARALERIALTDASPKVRGVAASMLGDWGEKRSIRVLKKLSRKDPHDRVRKGAERAIKRIRTGSW